MSCHRHHFEHKQPGTKRGCGRGKRRWPGEGERRRANVSARWCAAVVFGGAKSRAAEPNSVTNYLTRSNAALHPGKSFASAD